MTDPFRDAEHAGWTARADRYDRVFTPISNQAIPHMLTPLGDLRGKRVLDICCGSGHMTAALADKGATAEGIDFAATMIAKASAHYPAISFRQGDAEALFYPDNRSITSCAATASCIWLTRILRSRRRIASSNPGHLCFHAVGAGRRAAENRFNRRRAIRPAGRTARRAATDAIQRAGGMSPRVDRRRLRRDCRRTPQHRLDVGPAGSPARLDCGRHRARRDDDRGSASWTAGQHPRRDRRCRPRQDIR
jgi:SAM-dependent methyltransferase